jgi:hypothetical protein
VKALLFALGSAGALYPPGTWVRPEYDDAYVVSRSEHIVVGHLREHSIIRVPHAPRPDEGRGEEHHVALVITSVLKGDLSTGEIPLTVHYGLTPRVADHGALEIWDTGNSGVSPTPLVKDARQDHLWFLRKRGGDYGREAGIGNWGIVDPEDVAPLSLKDYTLAYLSENPVEGLKAFPDLGQRSATFLAATDLKKILREEHPYGRADALLLFLIRNPEHRKEGPAEDELISLFENDLQVATLRGDVMNVWGSLRDKTGVEPMIRLLQRQEDYWKTKKPDPGWLISDVRSWLGPKRYYAEARHALSALRRIGDPRARSEVDGTRTRWLSRGVEGARIVRECDLALKAFAR